MSYLVCGTYHISSVDVFSTLLITSWNLAKDGKHCYELMFGRTIFIVQKQINMKFKSDIILHCIRLHYIKLHYITFQYNITLAPATVLLPSQNLCASSLKCRMSFHILLNHRRE